jgi:4-hydroxy-3-polyprenylbenzoate decarboxylase
MEDCWMAKAWERILAAFLMKLIPAVVDLHFPLEWIFHQSGVISLENPLPGMVRETAEQLWSTPWFRHSRTLIFVDAAACRASDISQVAWHSINLIDFAQDLYFDTDKKRTAIDATGSGKKCQRIV